MKGITNVEVDILTTPSTKILPLSASIKRRKDCTSVLFPEPRTNTTSTSKNEVAIHEFGMGNYVQDNLPVLPTTPTLDPPSIQNVSSFSDNGRLER